MKPSAHPPTDLIVALDYPNAEQALKLVDKLQGLPVVYKVGLELFMAAGPDIVKELVHRKNRIFLDLKFHDIPNTVAKAAAQAAFLQVEMFTLHNAGGSAMIRMVAEELAAIPSLKPKILGVSVLTSFDDIRWAEVTEAMTGHAADVEASMTGLITNAGPCGLDGVVCSALELPTVKARWPHLYAVVPGIRPAGSSTNDQARVMTPLEARAAGADAVVVGRPITQSQDSRAMAEAILKDLSVVIHRT
jgi:orotidine-5'-phosphate decarboxylase